MTRVFHPWNLWEDYKYNFYGGEAYDTDRADQKCVELFTNKVAFAKTLSEVIKTWKYSCEHNLTNQSLNHIAYLGQAACALRFRIPHMKSMGYFNLLSEDQKLVANDIAKSYFDMWVQNYEYTKKV